jgi:hypothetical protein
MTKVKVNFYTTNMFNVKQQFTRDEVIVEVANGKVFDKYLKAETEAFLASIPAIENKLFGEEASKTPLMAHVDFDFFVDADDQADVYLS